MPLHPRLPGRRFLPLLLLLFGGLTGCTVLDPRQGNLPAPGIVREEWVTLGGSSPEWLLIRGRDPVHNPVLLFLHGGPGFPAAPFARVNAELERDFTVVHWDQRDAGHSYRPDLTPDSLRVERFVQETLQLSRHLCTRFGQRKIYLVGHSWGTLIGVLAVAREPGLFHAYVGLGQVVDINASERVLSRAALQRARANREAASRPARELRALGSPAPDDLAGQDELGRLLNTFHPRVQREATNLRLAALAVTSRYYSLADLIFQVLPGYNLSRRQLNPQIYRYDLRRQVPRLDVPCVFMLGRYDTTVGTSVAAGYLTKLDAPRGKRFVLFEDSTHWPHLEEPARFAEELRRLRADTWPEGTTRARATSAPGSMRLATSHAGMPPSSELRR